MQHCSHGITMKTPFYVFRHLALNNLITSLTSCSYLLPYTNPHTHFKPVHLNNAGD